MHAQSTPPLTRSNITPAPIRVLSVHSHFSPTNIPLEAFADLAQTTSDQGTFACGLVNVYADSEAARQSYATMYDPAHVDVFGLDWRWHRPWRTATLARWLKQWQPDVVHVHHAWSAALVATIAKRCTSARLMTTIHRDYRTLRRPQQILLNVAMRHSDVVLCNSYSTLRSLRDACQLDPAPILRVVYNGVDIRQLVAAAGDKVPRSNSNTHTLRIGSVGRFLPIKGFHDLLHAVGHLRQNNRDVHLTLVGDGPERTALRGLARELGIDKQVTFTGGVPRSEVYRLLHEMDVFVASSHSEGFCNAMVEAMAAGCAVVATDIPVFQELLGKDHPMYYDPGNVRQLAERLEHCVQAPAWSRHIGQQLQAQATARLSLAACTRNHLAVYRQLAQYARSQPATRELLAECHRKAA